MPCRKSLWTLAFLLGALLVTGACRSNTAQVAGTDLAQGDAIYGRLVDGRQGQSFTFEGVEGSMLSFHLVSDEPSQAAPMVALLNPEGKSIDLAPFQVSEDGAATARYDGTVLLRTGTFQVTVTPTDPCVPVYYRFMHALEFPPIDCMPVTLSACEPRPVYVSAPRGGQVMVKVTPKRQTEVVPLISAVEDPWGGRALDASRRPSWAPPATVHEDRDGSIYLNFTAPIPGRYKVLAASRDGTCGPAFVSTRVTPPPCPRKAVWHPNRRAQDFGVSAAGSASDPGPVR